MTSLARDRRPRGQDGASDGLVSIRLDNRVIEHFRAIVEKAGGGNYQALINDALVAYIQQSSVLDAVRKVVREEISSPKKKRGLTSA